MKLYIGNKNYSSWSMRPWVLMRQATIAFEEVLLPFDSFDDGSEFKKSVGRLGAAGRVPVLEDGENVVWDSLAIAEYLAERFPDHNLWPAEPAVRAHARSACAEMHSGFHALRSACPMNIDASLPEIGRRVQKENAALRADLARLATLWESCLARHGGPMLYGAFSVADAFFAPVVMRIRTYELEMPPSSAAYAARVASLTSVIEWIDDALAEKRYLDFEEPYRSAPGVLREEYRQ